MKVILQRDVAKIGKRFEVVVVPDGYALNKLLPNNMAKAATPENLKTLASTKEKQKEGKEQGKMAFAQLLLQIENTSVVIEVEANTEGTMFQGLKAQAVSEAIFQATGVTLDVEHVIIKTPIKSLGTHSVTLVWGEQQKNIHITLIPKSK